MRVVRHKLTNHSYQVVAVARGQYVDLLDTERRPKRVAWADWTNNEVWERLP